MHKMIPVNTPQIAEQETERVVKVIIMGAAGRDFHNFNVYFRNNKQYKVVAFAIVAKKLGASEIVDPHPYAVGSIGNVFMEYTHLGAGLPSMGYGGKQIRELEETINATPCDVVVFGNSIDLLRVLRLNKPAVRVKYELQEVGKPDLEDVLRRHFPRKERG